MAQHGDILADAEMRYPQTVDVLGQCRTTDSGQHRSGDTRVGEVVRGVISHPGDHRGRIIRVGGLGLVKEVQRVVVIVMQPAPFTLLLVPGTITAVCFAVSGLPIAIAARPLPPNAIGS